MQFLRSERRPTCCLNLEHVTANGPVNVKMVKQMNSKKHRGCFSISLVFFRCTFAAHIALQFVSLVAFTFAALAVAILGFAGTPAFDGSGPPHDRQVNVSLNDLHNQDINRLALLDSLQKKQAMHNVCNVVAAWQTSQQISNDTSA